MQTRKLKLPDAFIEMLVNLPENGMGYQIVRVILRSGKVLNQHKVLNSSFLVLEKDDSFSAADIEKIELENLHN